LHVMNKSSLSLYFGKSRWRTICHGIFAKNNLYYSILRLECKIMQNTNPLTPPIFCYDEYGYCLEWNASMEKFT
jgi:hypothetical protein